MKLSQMKTNVSAVEQGQWIGPLPGWNGLRLKVRGVGNADYRALQRRLNEEIPRVQWQTGKVPPEKLEEITARLFHETILQDWDGLMDDIDGTEIAVPYSRDMAWELLSKPEFGIFQNIVATAASLVGAEDAEAEGADAKN